MSGEADPLVRRAVVRVGTTLRGKWTLDALLGTGGMACVYVATHRNAKRAAIKMLHAELSVHPDIRARFLREGYVANTVGHPGAVSVLDDDVAEDGAAFIVMELLEGETVHARAERKGGRLVADEVLSIADQLLDVLIAAHAKGIIHRDLKPENLFLDQAGQVKVLDFGIARLRESTEKSQSGTRTGALMGTPSFMPPEQARGMWDEVDGRTDLWAVGATMFTLLAGRAVHMAKTGNEALALAVTQPAPSLATAVPDAPDALTALVDRALAYDKEQRFPDAASMQAAVRDVYATLHEEPKSEGPSRRVPVLVLPETGSIAAASTLPAPIERALGSAARPAVTADPPADAVGGTTTRGVASSSAPLVAKRRPLVPIAGAAVVVVVAAVGIAAFVSRGHGVVDAPLAIPAASEAAPIAEALPAPAPSAAQVPVASAVQESSPPPSASAVAAAAPEPAPPVRRVERAPARPAHVAKPAPKSAPAPAAAPLPAPSPPAAPLPPPAPAPAPNKGLGGRL